jgi:hypothetical protein
MIVLLIATIATSQMPPPPPTGPGRSAVQVAQATKTTSPAAASKKMARLEDGAFPEDQGGGQPSPGEAKPATNSGLLGKLTEKGLVRVKAQYVLPAEQEILDRSSKGHDTFATWRQVLANWGRIVEARANVADLQDKSEFARKEIETARLKLDEINQEYGSTRVTGRRSDIEQMRSDCNDVINRDNRFLSQANTALRGLYQQLGTPRQQNEAEAAWRSTSEAASRSLSELREMIDKTRAEYGAIKKELNPAIIAYNKQFKPTITLGTSAAFERVAREVRATEIELGRPPRPAKR